MLGLAEEGIIYFQDEASQMVAESIDVPQNGYFLDVCAAPGGKTGLVALRNRENSIFVGAGDLHWTRVKMLAGQLFETRFSRCRGCPI